MRQQSSERKLANQIEDWLDALQWLFEPFRELPKGPADAPADPTGQPQTDCIGAAEKTGDAREETPVPAPTEGGGGETRSEAEDEVFARLELLPTLFINKETGRQGDNEIGSSVSLSSCLPVSLSTERPS
jgi:hypothetical protein